MKPFPPPPHIYLCPAYLSRSAVHKSHYELLEVAARCSTSQEPSEKQIVAAQQGDTRG